MSQQAQESAEKKFIPRPEKVSEEYLRDILDGYYLMKWNPNKDTVAAVSKWKDWPLVVRMPDVKLDFTILIDHGVVQSVTAGLPDRPRILCVMLSETRPRSRPSRAGSRSAATRSSGGGCSRPYPS
jgi:hypothetical protein